MRGNGSPLNRQHTWAVGLCKGPAARLPEKPKQGLAAHSSTIADAQVPMMNEDVCMSVCMSVCLSVRLSVCLSVCLYVCVWVPRCRQKLTKDLTEG